MIKTSEGIKAVSMALYNVQAAVQVVRKDSKNPHFKSNYASLEAVMDAVKPSLNTHGILLTQGLGAVVDGALEVTTRLTHHGSGEWLESTMHVPLQKRDPQGVGSAATYGLRYSIMALLGLPPVDDDGEAAIDRIDRNPPETKPAKNTLSRDAYTMLETALRLATTRVELKTWVASNKLAISKLPPDWQTNLRTEYTRHMESLPEGYEDQAA